MLSVKYNPISGKERSIMNTSNTSQKKTDPITQRNVPVKVTILYNGIF